MKELLIAIDWEVGPYYNDALDGGRPMPSIDVMVELVISQLLQYHYTEGSKVPRDNYAVVPSYKEVYSAVAREYYPHLALLSMPTVYLWSSGEMIAAYYDFASAIGGIVDCSDDCLVTVDGVPLYPQDAIDMLRVMVNSGHYEV